MTTLHVVLYAFAVVFFVLAGFPNLTAPRPVQCQWLAFACLTLTLLV
jgi:hypothetical protein